MVNDNSGTLTKYINGQGIDNKLRVQTGSDVNYFLADHLGSTNGLTDSSGNLTALTNYDAFGNATNASFPTRYQFTGREHDSFTGLHYYRARFYDANLGRFISEDPIGFRGGDINLYGYVRNKPLKFSDPFGLDEYSMAERLGNRQPTNRTMGEMLDDLQLMLGSIGMTPGIGEPADAVDGLISLARGDYVGAALSGGAMIPFIGWGAGATKICKRTDDINDGLKLAKNPPSGGAPSLNFDPYSPKAVNDRVKPSYEANPAHNPFGSSYNPRKTPEPIDADALWNQTTDPTRTGMGTWWVNNRNGQYYRYSGSGSTDQGVVKAVHFSGTFSSIRYK